jgi:hypothetical protein
MIGVYARKLLARLTALNKELERTEGAEATLKIAAKLREKKEE